MSPPIRSQPDRGWESFAASEPWFAVLTQPRYLRANIDAAAESAFFKSGADYVTRVLDVIRYHHKVTPQTVLEFGCGPGRLAIPFAQRDLSVTAVDVSPAMLAVARANAAKQDVSNISFLGVAEFLGQQGQYDLVNCHLVFQRLPRAEVVELLRLLGSRVAPGGVGVFHFPYRSGSSPLVGASRWLREHLPGINAVVNILRGKPASLPFMATHTFDLHEALDILKQAGLEHAHPEFSRDGDLDEAVVYARRNVVADLSTPSGPVAPVRAARQAEEGAIDVKQLIAATSIEDLNRRAELYFSSLEEWEPLLAKPFMKVADAAPILINLGVLLQGLRFWPGQTILDFGGGTGWLSRILTQLGAKAIVLDVSPTALDMARELYAKVPVVGERPAPRFLLYDGRRISLPDASVDRIVCFDAFHHAPDPGAVLKDFSRILKSGGVAAFAEPGPEHSRSAQSQFEMRTYHVVENDVDIYRIWADAQVAGFVDLKIAAFNVPPFHVSLEEFDDLLAAGKTYGRWAEATRVHLGNARGFFLTKAGSEPSDSREANGLAAVIKAAVRGEPRARQPITLDVSVTNTGRALWLPSDDPVGGVSIGVHVSDGEGNLLDFEYHWEPLPKALPSGEGIAVTFAIPGLAPGSYRLEIDCVAAQVTWFALMGSKPAIVEIAL